MRNVFLTFYTLEPTCTVYTVVGLMWSRRFVFWCVQPGSALHMLPAPTQSMQRCV